ncbi:MULTISPECIES: Bug family tripartite tricarboxylate transporter substrate binding protein [Ramlibacter]|uniref:Tripartite tricarboxylate transporter substrate binding protein n=1 Tax=Ramlibacter pinisoli TaxID=2682844 RepID=A0A6N8IZB2_9BURK|nr:MULTISPECIES: tripartite tricarboxylate transporter substrate binding protein [Ramlibacter]MBA2961982.1 tripartite tricarboxylate transporter substrate binding protein [Ramlibacter sp. CGMCC 1.13660]MVQ31925.1 tripartite tricarboxylate transporter substrate binding protein [Ramlibacter pinisoli]
MPLSRRTLVAVAVLALATGSAFAQAWPAKPIRLVVPFPAGGSTDIVGRLVADKLAQSLGQAVVVDNRAGAGGTSGSDVAAKAPPDGYTLLLGTSSTHAIAPALYPKLPYDATRDFVPVSLLGTATILMVVHPSVPAKSVAEFIALAKARPGQLMFGSTGNGSVSHLTAEYFKSLAGVDLQHVPYKGDSPMTLDLVAGRVQVAFGTAVAFLPYVQAGKLHALAVTDAKASPVAPQLPTVAASGLPGFEALQWFGLLAPAGTPREIVARVNAEVTKALQLPEVQEKLQGLGMQIVGGTPEQFGAFQRAEAGKWARIVKDSGAKVD